MKMNRAHPVSSPRRLEPIRVALIAALLSACADGIITAPKDGRSHTIAAERGQTIDVILGNVGPAIYASPPLISSESVTFVGVDVIPPNNPGGPTQRFRFRAVSAGEAVVRFQRELGDSVVSVVEDTIRVR